MNRAKDLLGLICAALAGTLIYYRFQVFSGFSRLNGDLGDSRLVSVLNQHWCHVISGQRNWLDLDFYFPIKKTLGYSDAFFASGVLSCFYGSVTGQDFLLTTQYSIMTLHFVGGLIFALYLRHFWKLGLVASMFGGLLFQINAPLMSKIGHLQMQVTVFLPIVIWCLSWLVRNAGSRSVGTKQYFAVVVLVALSLHLQMMTTFYPAWFFCFFAAIFAVTAQFTRLGRRLTAEIVSRRWVEVILGGMVFGLLAIPFIQTYLPVVKEFGGRSLGEGLNGLPHPSHFLRVGDDNIVWGGLMSKAGGFFPGLMYYEKQIGIGLVLTAVYLYGIGFAATRLWRPRPANQLEQKQTPIDTPSAACAVFLYLFPTCLLIQLLVFYLGNASPWILIHHYVPGASAIRAAGRYMCVLMMPLSFGFAVLLDCAIRRVKAASHRSKGQSLVLVLGLGSTALFALIEQIGGKYNYDFSADQMRIRKLASELSQQIAASGCKSFYVAPVHPSYTGDLVYVYQVDAMLLSEYVGIPSLNGYSGQFPKTWGLWKADQPDYSANVNRWMEEWDLQPQSVCRFEYRS